MLACTVDRVDDPNVGVAVDGSVYKNMELFRIVLEEKTKALIKPGTDVSQISRMCLFLKICKPVKSELL